MKRNTGGQGGEKGVAEKERWMGGRERERKKGKRSMNQGERKPSPIGDTSSNSSEKQFSLPNKLNILIQKEAPACVECEWADRS